MVIATLSRSNQASREGNTMTNLKDNMNLELYEVMQVLEDLYNNNHKQDLTAWEVDDMLKRSICSLYKVADHHGYSVSLDSHISASEELI